LHAPGVSLLDQNVKLKSLKPSTSSIGVAAENAGVGFMQMPRLFGRLASFEWSVAGTIALLVILGFALRVNQLGAVGFAEDEMNKLDAVHAYQKGDFSANAEHPMLMKVLMYGSLAAANGWHANVGRAISDEAALRFPNALFGALTVIPLFLLTSAFFDRRTGLLAAAFWAGGLNAIALNRIGKEDTLLVFFMLFGFYFYLCAKLTSPRDQPGRKKNYFLSSLSFALMIASKYFPHYFGLNMLYHHNTHVRKNQPGEPTGKTPGTYYLLIIVFFVILNPAILLPQVWQYMNAYMGERLLVHSGYLFAGQLYKNNMSSSPFWGTPIYFYLLFLAIKVPLLVVVAFVSGLVVSIKRWRQPAYAFLLFMLLFWIVPYSLVGGKWLRYTLALLPFVYMLAAVGLVTITTAVNSLLKNSSKVAAVASFLIVAAFVVLPAWTTMANAPHHALYTNALAPGKEGYFFPHDEFYDDGLREAIRYVCDNAPAGAVIAHETPATARYYLERFGRQDLDSHAMSAAEFDPARLDHPAYIIVQRGRTYFENQTKVAFVRASFRKVHEVKIGEATAAEVFTNQ